MINLLLMVIKHDRDILMGKTVWERLYEKINFALYFPIDEKSAPDRRSLYNVLTKQSIKEISEVYSDKVILENQKP
jgi:hypothetical protein